MTDNTDVVAAAQQVLQLRNLAADKSKSGRKQGSAALRKFNEYLSIDHEHLHLPDNINFEALRLTDFRSGGDDSTHLEDMLGRYGHFLFSHCKLSWKTADQYLSALKGLIIGRFSTLTLLFNGFYKLLRHNLHVQYDERADATLTDIIKHHEPLTKKLLIKVCERLYGLRDYSLRCILSLDFHCIGRIKEIIKLPVSKLEVKSNPDTFMNCLMIVLNRYKTSSKSCLHLLHESNLAPNHRNWYSDPLHCIADMLARGSNASQYLFPHFSNRDHYIEMINGRLHSILLALSDDDLAQCNLSRESVGAITSHGVRAGAIIHANGTKGISPHWTELRAGISREKVASISSYDRLTDPVDLRIARANLDWPDVEQGGWSPISHQIIPLEDRENFKKFVDTLYSGCVEAWRLRQFLGIALLLDYEDVNLQFPGSQMHLTYTINLIGLNESYLLQWCRIIKKRYYDINNQYLSIGNSPNITQQQYQERVDSKLQYVIDGQIKLCDQIMEAKETITVAVTKTLMESITHISMKDTRDDPPPPKKQRQMLIAPLDNRMPSGTTSNDIELNMKHVTIAATVNDYYSKQYYQCVSSTNCTNNNASQALKKMKQLIYSLHYLAKDDMSVITWCKTPPIQRAEDWASRMLAKSLSLQDLAMQKLREYGIRVHNKGPVFWSTVKTFQEKGLLELASNHYI